MVICMKIKNILLVLSSIIFIGILICLTILFISKQKSGKTSDNNSSISISSINHKRQSEEMEFIDKEDFKIIKDAYSKIDFMGEFKKGNTEIYGYYKKQYLKLLNCEATFFNKESQNEFFINEFNEMDYTHGGNTTYQGKWAETYEPKNYIYYFFDTDGDMTPELCVTDEARFVYIFKYLPDSDEFILWYEIPPTKINILGSRKLWWFSGSTPVQLKFFELNSNGEEELAVWFYTEEYYTDAEQQKIDEIYSVTFPDFTDKTKNVNLSEKMKNKGLKLIEENDNYYFRITEKQWEELTKPFYTARDSAEENIKEVTFTYENLFG